MLTLNAVYTSIRSNTRLVTRAWWSRCAWIASFSIHVIINSIASSIIRIKADENVKLFRFDRAPCVFRNCSCGKMRLKTHGTHAPIVVAPLGACVCRVHVYIVCAGRTVQRRVHWNSLVSRHRGEIACFGLWQKSIYKFPPLATVQMRLMPQGATAIIVHTVCTYYMRIPLSAHLRPLCDKRNVSYCRGIWIEKRGWSGVMRKKKHIFPKAKWITL